MVNKISFIMFILFALLIAGFIYREWSALSKEPEFVFHNDSGSVVNVEAEWRDSKVDIQNLRNGEIFAFYFRGEASMKLKIFRIKSEVEQKTIGYFTSGSSFLIKIGPVESTINSM